tara:strand:+ start:1268 stop:2335 length:1068 start_codon:yes stop_codon:yes gene_type:complete
MQSRTAIRVSTLHSQPTNAGSTRLESADNGRLSANRSTVDSSSKADALVKSFCSMDLSSNRLVSRLVHSGLRSLYPSLCGDIAQPASSGFGLRTPPATTLPESTEANITNVLTPSVATVDAVVEPAPEPRSADEILAELQLRSVKSAQSELAAGVREIGSTNRSPRVDEYTRAARMALGGEWCGYFVNWNYHVVAKELGGRFRLTMHSLQKGRDSYLYRSYTSISTATKARLDALAETHREQGSMRQLFVFENSSGHQRATRLRRPAEITNNFQELPIRPGDTALFDWGHLGLVESYDAASGRLTTIEGNTGNRVKRKVYDLSKASERAKFVGFGRPALGDFHLSENQIESLANE